ncbi:MAG: hypothetical protein ACPG4Z_04555 [Chitinophagales bacterium]
MIHFLQKIGNGKLILVAFILTFIFGLGIFSSIEKEMNTTAENPVQLLDLELGYSHDFVTTSLDNMGEISRKIYQERFIPADLVFPFVYGGFFIFIIAFLLKKTAKDKPKMIVLSLIPIAIIAFDYLENFNTLNILKTYPNHTISMVNYGSLMTKCKWGFIFISMLMVILLCILWAIKRMKTKS